MSALDGRVAVITGASRGIGRACALAFAAEGARVAGVARGEASLRELASQGIMPVVADVGDAGQVERAFGDIERELGPVDVLVNNAAILGPAAFLASADPDAWAETYRVNVFGTMLCAQRAVAGMMERRRGKIINVSSGAALAPIAGYTAYSSSKAAIIHLTVCLAEEVKAFGINVNCVGVWARTGMWEDQLETAPMPAVQHAAKEGWNPSPEENLGVLLFLASAGSDHLTGQYLAANSLPGYVRG